MINLCNMLCCFEVNKLMTWVRSPVIKIPTVFAKIFTCSTGWTSWRRCVFRGQIFWSVCSKVSRCRWCVCRRVMRCRSLRSLVVTFHIWAALTDHCARTIINLYAERKSVYKTSLLLLVKCLLIRVIIWIPHTRPETSKNWALWCPDLRSWP